MSRSVSRFATRRSLAAVAVGLGLFVLFVAMALLAVPPGGSAHANPVGIGLVVDLAGLGDRSFNDMAYAGLMRAESDLGVVGTVYTPTEEADFEPLLNQCAADGNALCVGTSWLLTDAIWAAAENNPATHYALVDAGWDTYLDNLRGIGFASEQVGYLAGTLAGLMSESRTIGAVAGMEIPPVQAFVEPFGNGARCARIAMTTLLTYTGSFMDPGLGAQVAQEQLAKGADVVFGVGGMTGSGGVLTATQSGAWGIGVDVDEYLTTFGGGSVPGADRLLTSARKRVDNVVFATISDEVSGQFSNGLVVYGLAGDGVGLAPFHETEPFVSQAVRDTLDAVTLGLIDGTIDPWATCTPRLYLPIVVRGWAP